MMAETIHVNDIPQSVGRTLGPSSWVLVDQELITAFGHLTNDNMWYHVDPERAARELPDGKTFAHGLLTLSLVPGMVEEILVIGRETRMLNYGFERLRFLARLPVDDRIRLTTTILESRPHAKGAVIRLKIDVESEALQQLVLVGEWLLFVPTSD